MPPHIKSGCVRVYSSVVKRLILLLDQGYEDFTLSKALTV